MWIEVPKRYAHLLFAVVVAAVGVISPTPAQADVILQPGVPILLDEDAPAPLHRAVGDLQRDLEKVFGEPSPIVHQPEELPDGPALIVAGPDTPWEGDALSSRVAGWESHAMYVREADGHPHVVLHGSDMRGKIFAVYTFSEHVLDIPPLWFWSHHEPQRREAIRVPADLHVHFDPPTVKWRAWFPNDQRRLWPWMQSQRDPNRTALHEAMLRLKLNTFEGQNILHHSLDPDRLIGNAQIARDFGFVLTSHHFAPFGTSLGNRWDTFWEDVKGRDAAPPLKVANLDKLETFWRYQIEAVMRHDLELIWLIAFRGEGDRAFWTLYDDAPETDAERGAVIQQVLHRQVELLRETTGRDDQPMRLTMYDEKSDLVAAGHLEPPDEPNLIWNFVAARRDHFPARDVRTQEIPPDQPVGYYMNFQFTSTGSHMVQAEGPWKMEQNFRMARDLADGNLVFSVVNAGNVREHLLELTANAEMMWDFDAFDPGDSLLAFCRTYFGDDHAAEAAGLYRDLFHAYWQQKEPDIEGFERQYLFQDLRLNRTMRVVIPEFDRDSPSVNPLWGDDWFRVDPADFDVDNELEAVVLGLGESIEKLRPLVAQADALHEELSGSAALFFNDNLRVQASFLLHASEATRHLCQALLAHVQDQQDTRHAHLQKAHEAATAMENVLDEAAHGAFETWYEPTSMFQYRERRAEIENLLERFSP